MTIEMLELLIVLMIAACAYSVGYMRGHDKGYEAGANDIRDYQEKYAEALNKIDEMMSRRMAEHD